MDRQSSFVLWRSIRLGLVLAGTGLLLACTTGCLLDLLGVAAHEFEMPPEYDGLAGKRVMVACIDHDHTLGPSSTGTALSHALSQKLGENVKEIQVVTQREIDEWIDTHDYNRSDYLELARGVHADMVVVIDLTDFSIRDGQTMFRGRANFEVAVYDMNAGGELVFQRTEDEVSFPSQEGSPMSDFEIDDARFRQAFIGIVAEEIGRYFYFWDYADEYARDAMTLGI